MTFDQFDDARWKSGMSVKYQNEDRKVVSVCFAERLLGLETDHTSVDWVRCENVTLLT
jgi:hypothetical protein